MPEQEVENEQLTPEQMTQKKWGDLILGGGKTGFTIVPDALLRHQGSMKISPSEMVVLLNLVAFWWFSDKPPFPGNETLARRIGFNKRTVQRAVLGLKKKGLIEVTTTKKQQSDGGYLSRREIDFSPLRRRLETLEGV